MIVAIKNQNDVNFLTKVFRVSVKFLQPKLFGGKSEALWVADELQGVKGMKYLGVYLGDQDTFVKNWDNILEKVEGRLKKWIFPKMSFRGCVLIINNLAASMLWCRLSCVPPL